MLVGLDEEMLYESKVILREEMTYMNSQELM
jgi:hypothetical protein